MTEQRNTERLSNRKISRRKLLKAGGAILLGSAAAAAVGGVIGRVVEKGGLEREANLFSTRGELFGKEVDGKIKAFIFEEAPSQSEVLWPVLRREPNQGGEEIYVKPGTQAEGIEVYGATYQSSLKAGRTTDPRDPKHTYGIWVRLETEVPIYDKKKEPVLDERGTQKTAKGFVAENFTTFTDQTKKVE